MENKINLWISVLAVRGKLYNGVKLSESECLEISNIIKKLKEQVESLEEYIQDITDY